MKSKIDTLSEFSNVNVEAVYKTIKTFGRPEINSEENKESGMINVTKYFHNHDGYEILVVLNGELNLYIEGDGQTLKAGNVAFINPYVFHRAELLTEDMYDRIVVNVKDEYLKSLCSNKTNLTLLLQGTPSNKLNYIKLPIKDIEIIKTDAINLQEELNSKEFGSDLLAESLLIKILVMLNRFATCYDSLEHKSIMPKIVVETFAYIEENLKEKITMKDLADHLCYNETYISRCFKNTTGTPLQQYILTKKIILAQNYLKEGYSPCDVCFMSGFNNYSNFSRTFVKYAGVSPKQYQTGTP